MKGNLINTFKKIKFSLVVRKLRIWLKIPFKRSIHGTKLLLPPEHLLAVYVDKYPKYDSFLPLLATFLSAGDTIVDVGANIGDTTMLMSHRNQSLNFICIEPDKRFFRYLKYNTRNIKNSQLTLINSLISNSQSNYSLDGTGGTKSMRLNPKGKFTSLSLDSVCRNNSFVPPIALIKTDVDGFDFDVLLSAEKIINEFKPLIFSEIYINNVASLEGYSRSIRMLLKNEYVSSFVFINTGIFLKEIPLSQLEEFLKINFGSTLNAKNFEYIDVLFTTLQNNSMAKSSIELHMK